MTKTDIRKPIYCGKTQKSYTINGLSADCVFIKKHHASFWHTITLS
jgi:hypothetical protein